MKNDLNFEYYSYLCATQLNNNNCMHEKLIILDFGSQTTQLNRA